MIDYEAAAGTAPSSSNLPFLEEDQDCKLLIIDSKNYFGRNGNKYIIKARVLEVSPTGKIASPAVGADRTVIINLDPPKKPGDRDYGMENLMNYAFGLNGGPIEGDDPAKKGAKLKRLLGQRVIDATEASRLRCAPCEFQPAFAIGMVVGNRTVGGMTKGPVPPPHPITYHNWYSVKQTPTQVLARRAALQANQPIQWPPQEDAPAAT